MKISYIFLTVLFVFVLATKSAYAYLDPGTGSFILQVLAAGALGGLFAVKTFWRQITDFLRRIFSKKPNKQTSVKKQKNGKR